MIQTQTQTINGNIPNTSIKKTTNQELKDENSRFNLFTATSHYNDNQILHIKNCLYVTFRFTNNNYAVKSIAADLYKPMQYPIPKNGHQLENKIAAIAYPDFDSSRWGSIGKPPDSPSHFHMILLARSHAEKNALIQILQNEQQKKSNLHYKEGTNKANSLYTLMDYSLKAFAQTGFGNNPKYEPILLPLDTISPNKNRRKKLSAIGSSRLNRHNGIPNHFTLGSGL